MKKKIYQPPMITKIQLEVKDSVLGICRTSTSYNPEGMGDCKISINGCHDPV